MIRTHFNSVVSFVLSAFLTITALWSSSSNAACKYCPQGNLSCRTCALSGEQKELFQSAASGISGETSGSCTVCGADECSEAIQTTAENACSELGLAHADVVSNTITRVSKPFSFCVDSQGNSAQAVRKSFNVTFVCRAAAL